MGVPGYKIIFDPIRHAQWVQTLDKTGKDKDNTYDNPRDKMKDFHIAMYYIVSVFRLLMGN